MAQELEIGSFRLVPFCLGATACWELQEPPFSPGVTAQSGDTVVVSRFQTEAFQFPCWYDMQIVLVFGHNRTLKQRYIHRVRMCP
jgi:hypothetical protein